MDHDNLKEAVDKYIEHENIIDKVIINYDNRYVKEMYDIFIKNQINACYDDTFLNYCAGVVWFKNKKYNKAIEYLSKVNIDDNILMNKIGICYKNIKQYDNAIVYFLKAISLGSKAALANLAVVYEKLKNFEQAEKYYIEAINVNRKSSIHHLAEMYEKMGKIDKAETYYLLGKDNGISGGYQKLLEFYGDRGNNDLLTKYSVEALLSNKKGDQKTGYDKINKICGSNKLKLYSLLESITNKNKFVNEKINELVKLHDIKCFRNKINILSKKDRCPICLDDDVLVIPKECAHFYCRECFIEISKCSICDNDISEEDVENEEEEEENI